MGHLGDNLEDYWSYQLLDEVIRQLDSGDAGDFDKLRDRLMLVNVVVQDMILDDAELKETENE